MNKIKIYILGFVLTTLFLSSCKEDFDLTMPYSEQAVVYAFLQHNDPWDEDTNFVLVNKAFVGELPAESMAAISDSINYPDYSELEVTLQRVDKESVNAQGIDAPIILKYMHHPKKQGLFANDNNIVFYTTKQLMKFQDVSQDPTPYYEDPYFYRLSIKKKGEKEVRAVTKMIRGIIEERPFSTPAKYRSLNFASTNKLHKTVFNFKSNLDARVYQLFLSFYYYEKRTDDNIYIKKVDLEVSPYVTENKAQKNSSKIKIVIKPDEFYNTFLSQLKDSKDVVWRAIKITDTQTAARPETHSAKLVLGSQESYIYNQVTQPSDGIIQDKPLYTNIENGVGLFTSKWEHSRNSFHLSKTTLDSLNRGSITKNLKFLTANQTIKTMETMNHDSVIKDY